jgi:tetratricopeptide (TPR) repeat protein
MKTKILTGVFILLFAWSAQAQNSNSMITAFEKSYANEYAGKYNDAIKDLVNVYTEESYELNLRLGWLNYLAGNFTEAVSYYQRCIKLRPLSIEARLGLTYPASAVGNWEQVVNQYKDILKIAPSNYTANLRLGQIYLNRKDYSTAAKYLDLLISQYPFTYDVMISTAWNYYYQGKLREAKVLFQKILLIYAKDESAKLGLSSIK